MFCGGALGTGVRAAFGHFVVVDATHWPWPTFTVNLLAAFLLGYVATRLQERLPLSSYRRPFLGTGLCGGLSTFSTMQIETVRMVEQHAYLLAVGYTLSSVVLGLLAVHVATSVVRRVPVWR